jgi:electron transport complex protein RnfC
MDVSLFERGIRLPRLVPPSPVVEMPPPSRVELLLQQSAGPKCSPVVKEGDQVRKGQLVAEGRIGGAADLHTPICGVVRGFEDLVAPDGSVSRAVVVEADGREEEVEHEIDPEPLSRPPEELLERIRRGGIVTKRGVARSLEAILREATNPRTVIPATGAVIGRPVRQIAIRFTDIDPHLVTLRSLTATLDDRIPEVELGIRIFLRITGAESVHFVLDRSQVASSIRKLAFDHDFTVHNVDAHVYPTASDPLVAAAVSGQEPDVAFRGVHESGVLIVEIDTLLQVAKVVAERRPVLERVLTVAGPDHATVVRTWTGVSLSDIVEAAGHRGDIGKVILGGPMQGSAHHTLDFPIAKDTLALYLIPHDQVQRAANEPCVSCGLCVMVCPMRLVPGLLSRYSEFGQYDLAAEAHVFSCIECGCCAYVCPAHRSMVQFMAHAKSELLSLWRSAS